MNHNRNQHTRHTMKLKPGAHLILVCNDKGGSCKSSAVAEARVAAHLMDLRHRLVTFDQSNDTLFRAFRGKGVHTLAIPNGDVLLESFGRHIDEARANGELIIADMPPGITDHDNPILHAFKESTVFEEFDSIALIIPVIPHHDHIKGAFDALAAYETIPVTHARGLVRAWRPDAKGPQWASFPTYATLLKKFPVWECGTWMQSFSDIMQEHGTFSAFPSLDELPEFFATESPKMSTHQRRALLGAVAHLEKAREAIQRHLLNPITEPATKPVANGGASA